MQNTMGTVVQHGNGTCECACLHMKTSTCGIGISTVKRLTSCSSVCGALQTGAIGTCCAQNDCCSV
eukprot:2964408-Amphidinium_carterae.1